MFDTDWTFGSVIVTCDECGEEETVDGEGGPPPFDEVAREIKSLGWTISREDGDWVHRCPACAE